MEASRPDPAQLEVLIEVPRGGHTKPRPGRPTLRSPLPCPFNYGGALHTRGPDGDLVDVVLLGPARPRGPAGAWPVVGRVDFWDAGRPDPKWICADHRPTPAEQALIWAFFRAYGLAKAARDLARGRAPESGARGMAVWAPRAGA
jgi:inorganic pyrophosphatase